MPGRDYPRAMKRRLLPILLTVAGCDGGALSALVADADVDGRVVDFGGVYLGQVVEREIEIRSVGTGPLGLTAVVKGAGMSVADAPKWVAAGAVGRVVVRFSPEAVGSVQGVLRIEGDVSTQVDVRGEGLEVPGCDDNNDCTTDRFDQATATCAHAPRTGACNDGNLCTTNDRCSTGVCVGESIACDDGVECTTDACDPARGCIGVPNHGACADGDDCTLDVCGSNGCDNPDAPDGHPCGPFEQCQTANVCIFALCVEVPIPDGAPCNDGDVCTVEDTCVNSSCIGSPTDTPPVVLGQAFVLERPTSAAFAGDKLVVQDRALTALAFDGDDVAPVAADTGPRGAANMAQIDGRLYARTRTGTGSKMHVDLFDVDTMGLLVSWPMPGTAEPPFDTAVISAGGRIYFCMKPVGARQHEFHSLDPRVAGSLTTHGEGGCRNASSVATSGGVWVTWTYEPNGAGGSFAIYEVDAAGPRYVSSHGHNGQGVSRLGSIVAVATDGNRVVVDLENPSIFYIVDLEGERPQIGRGYMRGDLVAVHDRLAYLWDGRAMITYELGGGADTTPTQFRVPMGRPKMLARTGDRIALDVDGRFEVARLPSLDLFGVRGRGTVERVHADTRGVVASSQFSLHAFADAHLRRPSVATTPESSPFDATNPTLIDGPDGPAGLIGAVALNSAAVAASTVQFDGAIAQGSAPATLAGPVTAYAFDGCAGLGLSNDDLVWLDRCAGVTETGRMTAPGVYSKVVLHGPRWASLLGDSSALIDRVAMTVVSTSTLAATSAAYGGGEWILGGTSTFRGRVLMTDGRRAYVSGDGGLEIWSTDGQLQLRGLPMSTPPVSAVVKDDEIYFARPDGVTVTTPACAD